MPNYYAYLRVSRDVQDVKNQLHGIHEYANDRRMTPLIQIRETASRSKTWQEREIGTLLTETAQKGDVILTSEITRIAGSPMQVFSMLEVAAKRGINIIVTKMDMPLNSGLNGQIQAAVYAIASMIESMARRPDPLPATESVGQGGDPISPPKGNCRAE